MIVVALLTAALLATGLRLRRRLSHLRPLPAGELRRRPSRLRLPPEDGEPYTLVVAEGVTVPADVRHAASAYARRTGCGVVDLIPADLPVEAAFDLLRSVDPRAYRADPVGRGRGAGYAILIDASVRERWDSTPPRSRGDRLTLDGGEMAEAVRELRQYAEKADLVVAPITGPVPHRRTWLKALGVCLRQDIAVPQVLGLSMIGYALAWAALPVDPVLGWIPLLAYCAVPYVVFAGQPLRPRDLHRLRLVATPLTWWRTLRAERSRWERDQVAAQEAARGRYQAEIAEGVDRFLEPRRDTCPWCGSGALRVHVRTCDLIQCKPGRFALERCGGCGHVFQNPRLTPDGLDFYYRDVYDGLGAVDVEAIFAGQESTYRARAELVATHTEPRTWLDVGTGHAHFCRTAARVLPGTVFDGLDMGPAVREAARRGWLRHAYQGLFPDLLEEVADRYDVISMHHYLEHTREPLAELDTAAKALGPGGHLMIELPDPESRYGRLLRMFWVPWLAPQHQHMMPIGNLTGALRARGLQVVAEVRREARQGGDIPGAALALLNALWIDPRRPWAPARPLVFGLARRTLAAAIALPLAAVAIAADVALLPFQRDRSNAYRVLARKSA